MVDPTLTPSLPPVSLLRLAASATQADRSQSLTHRFPDSPFDPRRRRPSPTLDHPTSPLALADSPLNLASTVTLDDGFLLSGGLVDDFSMVYFIPLDLRKDSRKSKSAASQVEQLFDDLSQACLDPHIHDDAAKE
ncbi:hypothetical protein Cni_G05428 [Canna indica]|uniref:Uncharacterized protein n=1 Tax=Canna indica TaxID=4628 RepID=A0AAQ3JV85_9LILI|nr:hypothetical protein Cni_G05428 [Canna indica]